MKYSTNIKNIKKLKKYLKKIEKYNYGRANTCTKGADRNEIGSIT